MATKIETKLGGMVTVPEMADLPDPMRLYVKDEVDLAAYRFYARSGFHPPERPNGFLDEGEAARWDRLRERAAERET